MKKIFFFDIKKFDRPTGRQTCRIIGGQTNRHDDMQIDKLDNLKTDTQTFS